MKKFISVFLSALFLFSLGGCGTNQESQEDSSTEIIWGTYGSYLEAEVETIENPFDAREYAARITLDGTLINYVYFPTKSGENTYSYDEYLLLNAVYSSRTERTSSDLNASEEIKIEFIGSKATITSCEIVAFTSESDLTRFDEESCREEEIFEYSATDEVFSGNLQAYRLIERMTAAPRFYALILETEWESGNSGIYIIGFSFVYIYLVVAE